MKNKDFSEYTEAEFMTLVRDIFDGAKNSEKKHHADVIEFNRIVGHPSGSDLIYYPNSSMDPTPDSVVNEVKEWRAKNGMPGLKSS
ncbi:Pyocin-S2 immunity protein [compost metagenome]|jgi:hypothetical protein|uniref:bacteriocin immunity protein n=1 Tax=Pseudomonas sp. FW305-70 TaxID=2751342 RepID=UPI000C882AC3|nr:bacteriocin immunity protein [Pseudomonas sp. FW305-70]PMZ77134.1 bacteriocin immunity protein [Pseudomonas sp. FW305-70]